ncbi:MAG TPA: hypothetical protein PK385_04855 [Spirochaetota bacterium]|jgi:hypothetical protein|nr:MAG: hypothetical protein BWX91_00199 [Spirochaetes bacterium ADurb.Bin133]HNZ25796.1 hypothetical protein [Spirochaetota bacterium]HOF01424.1 hypothetical protein [Spirochaetota bacterium]HOS33014.1 hypothetical protein [Spirochaetota bacterium]HOS55369.1 hypothetical protein [Spirochaetota bacterium]
MSEFQKNLEEDNQKETPMTYAIGILILCCSLIPILYGISMKNVNSLIIGGITMIASALLIFFRFLFDKFKK